MARGIGRRPNQGRHHRNYRENSFPTRCHGCRATASSWSSSGKTWRQQTAVSSQMSTLNMSSGRTRSSPACWTRWTPNRTYSAPPMAMRRDQRPRFRRAVAPPASPPPCGRRPLGAARLRLPRPIPVQVYVAAPVGHSDGWLAGRRTAPPGHRPDANTAAGSSPCVVAARRTRPGTRGAAAQRLRRGSRIVTAYEERLAAHEAEFAGAPVPSEPWAPSANGQHPSQPTGEGDPCSWEPIDLGPYLRGEVPPPQPPALGICRSDGLRMIYAGREHVIVGATESAKSWLALGCVAAELAAGRPAIYIHYEESGPESTIERLRLLGVDDALLTAPLFRFVAPHQAARTEWITAPPEPPPALVGQ